MKEKLLSHENKYDILWCLSAMDEGDWLMQRLQVFDAALLRLSGKRHLILVAKPSNKTKKENRLACVHDCQIWENAQEHTDFHQRLRQFLKTGCQLQADVVILPVQMLPLQKEPWLENMLEALTEGLQSGQDFIVGQSADGIQHSGEQGFFAPLLEAFYGMRMPMVWGSAWGIRLELTEAFYRETGFWAEELPYPGMIFWMLTRAILWNKKIAVIPLPHEIPSILEDCPFAQWSLLIGECLHRDGKRGFSPVRWLKTPQILFEPELEESPGWDAEYQREADEKRTFQQLQALIEPFFPTGIKIDLSQRWQETSSAYAEGVKAFLRLRPFMVMLFQQIKPELIRQWQQQAEQSDAAFMPMYYIEQIPGKPFLLPQKLQGRKKNLVVAETIYHWARERNEHKLQQFLQGLPGKCMEEQVRIFMEETEQQLAQMFPEELHTGAGMTAFVQKLWKWILPAPMLRVQETLFRELLIYFPPIHLMLYQACRTPEELWKKIGLEEAVALSELYEDSNRLEMSQQWLAEHLRPESFHLQPVIPMVLDAQQTARLRHFTGVSRLTGRIFIHPLDENSAGGLPHLQYLLEILYRIAQIRIHSELILQCQNKRRDIGKKFYHSLYIAHHHRDFSAAEIFVNLYHRRIPQMLREMAQRLEKTGETALASSLRRLAQGYGVGKTLPQGDFLSCSGWTWTQNCWRQKEPLRNLYGSHLENRWFSHLLLEEWCRQMGFSVEELTRTVYRQIVLGQEDKSLLELFCPFDEGKVEVMVQPFSAEAAGSLTRWKENPILQPILEHPWENRYVLNPGALRIGEKVYLFYRAVGADGISRIGLAQTDGMRVLHRWAEPIFSPLLPEEKQGCEDPRVVLIEDTIWMLYTAYDGNIAQVAAATIKKSDFLRGCFRWKREGLAFRNIWDKDAVLFPQPIDGKYVLYHRVEPSMWLTCLPELKFPCRQRQTIILGPRPGQQWDSRKIGAGSPPLRTVYGWLLFYHGVDENYIYRLGVLLIDLHHPGKVLYRSPNAVLEPVQPYEVGGAGAWVANVVFTCGAVGEKEKDILEDEDIIWVYYGAADSSIGAACIRLKELLPESYRKAIQN